MRVPYNKSWIISLDHLFLLNSVWYQSPFEIVLLTIFLNIIYVLILFSTNITSPGTTIPTPVLRLTYRSLNSILYIHQMTLSTSCVSACFINKKASLVFSSTKREAFSWERILYFNVLCVVFRLWRRTNPNPTSSELGTRMAKSSK